MANRDLTPHFSESEEEKTAHFCVGANERKKSSVWHAKFHSSSSSFLFQPAPKFVFSTNHPPSSHAASSVLLAVGAEVIRSPLLPPPSVARRIATARAKPDAFISGSSGVKKSFLERSVCSRSLCCFPPRFLSLSRGINDVFC